MAALTLVEHQLAAGDKSEVVCNNNVQLFFFSQENRFSETASVL